MTRDNPHPRYLPNSYSPSIVETTDGENHYVANCTVKDNGYLYLVNWEYESRLIPPHRVHEVRRVTTERTSQNNQACKGVVDQMLVDRALKESGRTEHEPEQAIADGGEYE